MVTYISTMTRQSADIPFYTTTDPDMHLRITALFDKLIHEYTVSFIKELSEDNLVCTSVATFINEDAHTAYQANLRGSPIIVEFFKKRGIYNMKNGIASVNTC
jgi:hypothetical protein